MAKKKTSASSRRTASTRGGAPAGKSASRSKPSKRTSNSIATKKSARSASGKGARPAASAGARRSHAAASTSAHGERIRDQVRTMTASALHGEAPTPDRLGKLMRDVLNGTMEAMDAAMPPAFRSDKLREAADAFTGHVERVAHEFTRGARNVGRAAADPMMQVGKQATEAVRAAVEHPADAARESLHSGARVAAAGARAAAVGASRLMSATGGVLSGVAEGIAEAADRHGSKGHGKT